MYAAERQAAWTSEGAIPFQAAPPAARTIYNYTTPSGSEAYHSRTGSQSYVGSSTSSYPPTPCNCPECHLYNGAYAPSTSYTYRAPTPTAGLSYPFEPYQAQPQAGLQAPQPVYRLPARPVNPAHNTVLPPVPSGMTLPSPPIEDQLPHLAQLSAYQSTWSPGEPPAQMQLPERTSYSRPISRDRPSTSYLPRASPDSPHLRADAGLEPVPLQRRQSSGSTLYETALSRRSSALSLRSPLDSPYGSEYSFGAEDLDERAETATPFATKLNYLVNNPDLDEVIRWDASGTAFVFAHSAEALSSALSRVFRHGNTHSFVRQLNIYDFKRLNTVELHNAVESSRPFDSSLTSSDFAGFSHPLFFRETPTRRCDLVALKPKMGKKPSSRNLAAKTATAAADSASRTRTLRTEGKVGGGMKGRKV